MGSTKGTFFFFLSEEFYVLFDLQLDCLVVGFVRDIGFGLHWLDFLCGFVSSARQQFQQKSDNQRQGSEANLHHIKSTEMNHCLTVRP